uniref:Uncharacterized protein n=1 Tax=viral metagenome TaxID=1070528 RepID=A0A6C0D393_9ZZZZ
MKNIFLIILHIFHFLIDMIPFAYIYFAPKEYDIYIVVLVSIQCFHWLLLKNECIISCIEKWLINKNYEIGDDISYIPHEDFIYYNKDAVILLHVLQILVFCVIFYRNRNNSIISCLSVFNITVMVQLIYFRYFY